MSSPVDSTSSVPVSSRISAATALGANQQASTEVTEGSIGSVSSLQQLKADAPELYDAMMLGIAMNICNKSKDSQQRIREIMREERAKSGS